MSTEVAARITSLLVGTGLLIGGLEWWTLAGARTVPRSSFQWEPVSVLVNRVGFVRFVTAIHIAMAALLIVVSSHAVLRWAVVLLVITTVAIIRSFLFGVDASDYLNVAVLSGLGIYYCDLGASWSHLALGAIASVAATSYFIAGLSKLLSPYWGNGQALLRILDSATYGSTRLRELFAVRVSALKAIERAVIAAELAFPLVLVLPQPLLFCALGVGVAFHLTIAAIMGLNLFTFSYVATYPAIVVVSNAFGAQR